MRAEANEGAGTSIILVDGDRLDSVPKSHRDLITQPIHEVFADPVNHFKLVAKKCPFPQMAAWLQALLAEEEWYLACHRGDPEEWTLAGFGWCSDTVRSAEITPSLGTDLASFPAALRQYYSLVDRVQWMPFGCAGGLEGACSQTSLTTFPLEYHGATVDPAKTFTFGWAPGGDILIYTEDGRGGWACHENGKIHLLGTIDDTINWVYAELLANRCPDFDYDWA